MQHFDTINVLPDDKRLLALQAMEEDEFLYITLGKAIIAYCSRQPEPVDPDGDQFEGD